MKNYFRGYGRIKNTYKFIASPITVKWRLTPLSLNFPWLEWLVWPTEHARSGALRLPKWGHKKPDTVHLSFLEHPFPPGAQLPRWKEAQAAPGSGPSRQPGKAPSYRPTPASGLTNEALWEQLQTRSDQTRPDRPPISWKWLCDFSWNHVEQKNHLAKSCPTAITEPQNDEMKMKQ